LQLPIGISLTPKVLDLLLFGFNHLSDHHIKSHETPAVEMSKKEEEERDETMQL